MTPKTGYLTVPRPTTGDLIPGYIDPKLVDTGEHVTHEDQEREPEDYTRQRHFGAPFTLIQGGKEC